MHKIFHFLFELSGAAGSYTASYEITETPTSTTTTKRFEPSFIIILNKIK